MEKQLSVLYVDDEPTNLIFFKIMLQNQLKVVTAQSGKEALQILENGQHVDLIISDMLMPGMNGIEFLTLAEKFDNRIPRIMLSGYDKSPEIEAAINSGLIFEYLNKPLDRDRLMSLISEIE